VYGTSPTVEILDGLWLGDCLDILPSVPDSSIDSIVCDPPYELSHDGQASASGVFIEFAFPKDSQFKSILAGECMFSNLITEILHLDLVREIPSPTASMPKVSVALNDQVSAREIDVKDAGIGSIVPSGDQTGHDFETKTSEHLGCFSFEFRDSAALLNSLNSAGTGFLSNGVGIGFGVLPSSLPGLLHSCAAVINSDDLVRFINDSLPLFISTSGGAENLAMANFHLGRGCIDELSTIAALSFFAILLRGSTKLVRTSSTAGGLPAKLEARRVRVVSPLTDRALTFDLMVHPRLVQSSGFMGMKWDGSKIAFNVQLWQECLRVLKPGGHLLAFSSSRTYHRMACSIEDAGFEIRDQLMWIYSQGMPKTSDLGKVLAKKGHPEAEQWKGWSSSLKPAHEPIVMARKPLSGSLTENLLEYGSGGLNIGACRIEVQDEAYKRNCSGDRGHEGTRDADERGSTDIRNGGGSASDLGRWPPNVIFEIHYEPVKRLLYKLDDGIREAVKSYYADYRNVRHMQRVVPNLSESLEEGEGAVLLQELLPQGPFASHERREALHVWQESHQSSDRENDNPEEGLRIGASGTKQSEIPGRVDESRLSVSECGGPGGEGKGVCDTDDRQESRGHCRAPIGDGISPGSSIAQGRGCPSQERREIRQSTREFGTAQSIDTLQGTQAPDRGSKGFEDGERVLEVLSCDIPKPWQPYFEDAGFSVVSPHSSAELLDEQSGVLKSGANPTRRHGDVFRNIYSKFQGERSCNPHRGADVGGASRFYYCAKVNATERGDSEHPTMKPIALMRYLVRLVTPKGGVVLDPFLGSGTTAIACGHEGMRCIGIEREEPYFELAKRRVAAEKPTMALDDSIFDTLG
jgi:DNA modification methylase